jgi:hypothetical protein
LDPPSNVFFLSSYPPNKKKPDGLIARTTRNGLRGESHHHQQQQQLLEVEREREMVFSWRFHSHDRAATPFFFSEKKRKKNVISSPLEFCILYILWLSLS